LPEIRRDKIEEQRAAPRRHISSRHQPTVSSSDRYRSNPSRDLKSANQSSTKQQKEKKPESSSGKLSKLAESSDINDDSFTPKASREHVHKRDRRTSIDSSEAKYNASLCGPREHHRHHASHKASKSSGRTLSHQTPRREDYDYHSFQSNGRDRNKEGSHRPRTSKTSERDRERWNRERRNELREDQRRSGIAMQGRSSAPYRAPSSSSGRKGQMVVYDGGEHAGPWYQSQSGYSDDDLTLVD